MTEPPETPDLDALYKAAVGANAKVKPAYEAYLAATVARREAFRALRAAGQSFGKMAKRLPMSSTRVAQIMAKQPEVTE